MEPFSAGFSPASIVQPLTKKVMEAKNINIDTQYPKDLSMIDVPKIDLIVNMSGTKLPPRMPTEVRDWKVEDPIGKNEDAYVSVRDQIENLVMQLVLELRRGDRRQETGPRKKNAISSA